MFWWWPSRQGRSCQDRQDRRKGGGGRELGQLDNKVTERAGHILLKRGNCLIDLDPKVCFVLIGVDVQGQMGYVLQRALSSCYMGGFAQFGFFVFKRGVKSTSVNFSAS